MLQAHSLLWHYLWVAPNLILLVLAFLVWKRELRAQFPIFFVFAIATAVEQLTLYTLDVLPWVKPIVWWWVFWACLLLDALLKFALIGEIFSSLLGQYP